MVNFAGWEMPLQYTGILEESLMVRQKGGVFDVSHMGQIAITGKDSERFLDYLSTNQIAGKKDGTATYTVWCHESGGSVDDLIVYKIDSQHFFVVANAANRQKDLDHLIKESKPFDVAIEMVEGGILAFQGPLATPLIQRAFPEVKGLKPMHLLKLDDVIIAATGYTGAGGYEIFAPADKIISLWNHFTPEISPAGLGARDVLRLEMGYALYGHELNDTIAPTESVAAWTVKMEKPHFLGKEALPRYHRSQHGLELEGIAREGYEVFLNGEKIGQITSGVYSPTLKKGIAIVLSSTPLAIGTEVTVLIRNKHTPAKTVSLPFLKQK